MWNETGTKAIQKYHIYTRTNLLFGKVLSSLPLTSGKLWDFFIVSLTTCFFSFNYNLHCSLNNIHMFFIGLHLQVPEFSGRNIFARHKILHLLQSLLSELFLQNKVWNSIPQFPGTSSNLANIINTNFTFTICIKRTTSEPSSV